MLYVGENAENFSIVTDVYIFMLIKLQRTQWYSFRQRLCYCNTDDNGTRSSSEIQENRNEKSNFSSFNACW